MKNPDRRKQYYEKTSGRKPAKLLREALSHISPKSALELGCGAGVDSKFLAKKGVRVTAVDVNPEVREHLGHVENVNCVISPFQEFKFGNYDLIYSRAALVFMPREEFDEVIKKAKTSLNPKGIMALRLWGVNDSANSPQYREGRTFLTKEEIENMFNGFEVIKLDEIEKDGETALGKPKHWHAFDVIVRKP